MKEAIFVLAILIILEVTAHLINLSSDPLLVNVTVLPNTSYLIIIDQNLRKEGEYIIPQCHSQQHNFTMFEMNTGVAAKDIGGSLGDIVFYDDTTQLYVRSSEPSPFTLFCLAPSYDLKGPVPGGCNLEFNFMNDPNLRVWYDGFQLWIEFQFANLNGSTCEHSNDWPLLTYSVYVLNFENGGAHSEDSFAKSLLTFNRASDIIENGEKLMEFTRVSQIKPQMAITSYPDTAMIVGLVVTDSTSSRFAAYVSQVSYGCDIYQHDYSHPCSVQWYWFLLAAVLGLAGSVLVYAGHKLFRFGIFTMGFLASLLIAIIAFIMAQASVVAVLVGSFLLSCLLGFLWLLVWYVVGKPLLSLLITAADAGYVFGCIIFYSPLDNLEVFHNGWLMWLMYAVCVVLFILLLVLRPKPMNIICCALVGSYLVVAAISLFAGGTLHHIAVEPVRRATVERYYNALFDAPFLTADKVLVPVWIILFLSGSFIQFYTERKNQDFPEKPEMLCKKDCFAVWKKDEERSPLNDTEQAPPPAYGAT